MCIRDSIPALALGIDGVEGQGGFPGPGQPRQHHQLVPGDGDVDVLDVYKRQTMQWTGGSYELFDNLDDLHVELPIQWTKQ